MRWFFVAAAMALLAFTRPALSQEAELKPEAVAFRNGSLELGGELFKPPGDGPFPAVLYNHGSAPGMLNSQAAQLIGPMFAKQGWVFFMPYRRGQGLSAKAGRFIGDEITEARRQGGLGAAADTLAERMDSEHFSDQAAALRWLRGQPFVKPRQIATAGNSFGGVQALLGAQRLDYCAAVDASGGAESWDDAPALQRLMGQAAREARAPVFLLQAANDHSLQPSQTLAGVLKAAGHVHHIKIYPPFGNSKADGHSFAYRGASVWFPDVLAFMQTHCDGR